VESARRLKPLQALALKLSVTGCNLYRWYVWIKDGWFRFSFMFESWPYWI